MPKIPCRVESGPEGGRRGMQKCLRGKEGTFSSGKSPLLPGPPSPNLTGRTGSWRSLGEKGLDDTTGRDGKNVALSPSGCLPQELRVPPLLRRAPHSTGDQHGARGCRGCAGPDPLPLRRACPPGCWQMAVIRRLFHRAQADLFPRQRPPKTPRGRSPEEDRPLCKIGLSTGGRWFHRAAGGMTAKRRRTHWSMTANMGMANRMLSARSRCRHGRAAGCWSPSHAPRA